MKKHSKVLLGLALASSLAFGAAATGPMAIDYIQRVMKGGFYAGPTAAASTSNKVTTMLSTRCDFDFPSFGGAATATGFNFDSFACPLPGVALDDPCFTGIPRSLTQYDDAGTDILGANFGAYVSDAGFVKVRIFPMVKLDGGAGLALVDPLDAGYLVRCISSQ